MEIKHFSDCIEWWNNRKKINDEEGKPKSNKYTYKYFEENNFDMNLCGYPHTEEVILSLKETIHNYEEMRSSLNSDIDKILSDLTALQEQFSKGDF